MGKTNNKSVSGNSLLPLYPKLEPPGRVFLVWDISYRCNYNCSYCSTHQSLSQKDSRCIGINKMRGINRDMYDRYGSCHIRFSGGEPFVYSDFIEFLRMLSEYHTLEVSTNLSVNLEELKEKLNPETLLLSSSFHPEFINFHEFLEKILFLKNNKFNISVTFVAYPPFLRQMEYYKEVLEKDGIQFIIQPFKGVLNGKKYPDAYTDDERLLLKNCADTSLHRSANKRIFEHKTNIVDEKTKICRMGQLYARIDRAGDIFRCCAFNSPKLGNILDGGLKLLSEPMPCEIEPCACWKAMVIGKEQEWLEQWKYPKHPKQSEAAKEESNKINLVDNIVSSNLKTAIAPHRVFFTWDVHYRCNYKCSYCNAQKPEQEDFIEARYLRVDKWVEIWSEIYNKYGSCEIQLTGGEPFIYPGIIDLITQLSKIHTLEFSTNLSWDVEPFLKNIAPDRARVGVSFHPEFADFNLFLDKALKLKNSGFEVWVNYVAHPSILEGMPEYKCAVENSGMHFSILPFTGVFKNRSYPEGYLDSERQIMDTEDKVNIVNKKTMLWKVGEQKNATKGKLCRMGQMYAKIHPNGQAYRCCGMGSSTLGNLVDGTFELLDEPLSCECGQCPCWRCMLVGKEDGWSSHWLIPKRQS